MCKDRLILRETNKLNEILGNDPNPGKPKQLRIRYRLNGVHGMLSLDVMENNQIPEPVMLLSMPSRDLTIMRGAYGHPKGRTTTGRMSYDVSKELHICDILLYEKNVVFFLFQCQSVCFVDSCLLNLILLVFTPSSLPSGEREPTRTCRPSERIISLHRCTDSHSAPVWRPLCGETVRSG